MLFLSLICVSLAVLYYYRIKVMQVVIPIVIPYVLEYLTKNPKTLSVNEKEVSEAQIVGRLVKIPFRLNGQEYTYWTTYNRRAKSDTKYFAVNEDKREDLHWCPWLPLTITSADLKVQNIDIVLLDENDI